MRSAGGIQVIARAGQMLRAIRESPGGLTQSELAERLGLPRSTIHRILSALEDEELVASGRGPRGRYRLGPERMELVLNFIDPAELGFDTDRFEAAGYRAYACADIERGVMIHLARDTEDGFEIRSRFILDRGGPGIDAEDEAGRAFVHGIAYELFVHLQSEFTHLSTFLADLYGEFGAQRP